MKSVDQVKCGIGSGSDTEGERAVLRSGAPPVPSRTALLTWERTTGLTARPRSRIRIELPRLGFYFSRFVERLLFFLCVGDCFCEPFPVLFRLALAGWFRIGHPVHWRPSIPRLCVGGRGEDRSDRKREAWESGARFEHGGPAQQPAGRRALQNWDLATRMVASSVLRSPEQDWDWQHSGLQPPRAKQMTPTWRPLTPGTLTAETGRKVDFLEKELLSETKDGFAAEKSKHCAERSKNKHSTARQRSPNLAMPIDSKPVRVDHTHVRLDSGCDEQRLEQQSQAPNQFE